VYDNSLDKKKKNWSRKRMRLRNALKKSPCTYSPHSYITYTYALCCYLLLLRWSNSSLCHCCCCHRECGDRYILLYYNTCYNIILWWFRYGKRKSIRSSLAFGWLLRFIILYRFIGVRGMYFTQVYRAVTTSCYLYMYLQ